MLTSRKPNDFASWVGIFTLAFGYLAVAHFVIGLFFTLRLANAVPDFALQLVIFSLPYMGITLVFVASVVLNHLGRFGWGVLTFVFGLLVSVAVCAYDFQNARYQMSGSGHGPDYTIWWWYYEPYWHGYKPGNI